MRPHQFVIAMLVALIPFTSARAVGEDTANDRPTPVMDVPVMHEEALAAGIEHAYRGPWEFFVGGGAAVFDCNGDRKPDLFIAGGTDPAQLYVNKSAVGGALVRGPRDRFARPRSQKRHGRLSRRHRQ
ncbi:MAG: hypothetical protein R3D29_09860 [Nitratireductor sp.]